MEFDDYETLPREDFKIHMIAGAIAGIMEHCIMYPVDFVKTRMQSLAPSPEATYRSVKDGFVKIVASEGVLTTIRGASATVVGAGPAHAMYFAAYEGIKRKFGSKHPLQNHMANAGAGCVATLLHDAIMVPSEVVKQRMQVFKSPYKSCFDCMCKLFCEDGIRVFYRSYTTQMLMNLPFHATHIVIYEKMSQTLNPQRQYDPRVHMLAGACAGAFASAITTPLDVCKTLLNTQEASALHQVNRARLDGVRSAFRAICIMHGTPGFFRGMQARILFQMPGTAIAWSVYELFKHLLFNSPDDDPVLPIATPSPKDCHREKSDALQHASFDGGTPQVGILYPDSLYAIRSKSSLSEL